MLAAGVGQVMYAKDSKQNQGYFKDKLATKIKDILPNDFVINDEHATFPFPLSTRLFHHNR